MSFGEGDLHKRAEQLEKLVKWLLTCMKFGGWPCYSGNGKDCPYIHCECEDEWQRMADDLKIEVLK